MMGLADTTRNPIPDSPVIPVHTGIQLGLTGFPRAQE